MPDTGMLDRIRHRRAMRKRQSNRKCALRFGMDDRHRDARSVMHMRAWLRRRSRPPSGRQFLETDAEGEARHGIADFEIEVQRHLAAIVAEWREGPHPVQPVE